MIFGPHRIQVGAEPVFTGSAILSAFSENCIIGRTGEMFERRLISDHGDLVWRPEVLIDGLALIPDPLAGLVFTRLEVPLGGATPFVVDIRFARHGRSGAQGFDPGGGGIGDHVAG
jgi:hypothetical protein